MEKKDIQIDLIKKFNFFTQEELIDQQTQKDLPQLSDLQISQAEYIQKKFFFADTRKKTIYIYEMSDSSNLNTKNYEVKRSFQPYTTQLYFITKCSFKEQGQQKKEFLITYGIDEDGQQKFSYIKFWNSNYDPDQEQSKIICFLKTKDCKKRILIGTSNNPLTKNQYSTFGIDDQLQAMAFGLQDGKILLYRLDKSKNFFIADIRSPQKFDSEIRPIKKIFFVRQEQNLNLVYTTDENIYVLENCSNRRKLDQQGPAGDLFDVTNVGTIIGSKINDSTNLYEYDCKKNIYTWSLLGEKRVKTYTKEVKFIDHIVTSQKEIYIITTNEQGQYRISRLNEKENAFKMETFFKKSFFDVAYTFAKNQNADQELLAEISRLHGDHAYQKGDYEQAINHYIHTTGFVEPSYIIRKFLDVTHIDYLIKYLQEIHKRGKADKVFYSFLHNKHHTALLLNCYVKQKKITDLQNFLKDQKLDNELFDIETAIKVCRELKNPGLAISLAEERKQHQTLLEILINDVHNSLGAIDYIQEKVFQIKNFTEQIPLEEKTRYILEFGQILMKEKPYQMLQLVKNMVLMSNYAKKLREKKSGVKILNDDERGMIQALRIVDKDSQYVQLIYKIKNNINEFQKSG